MTPEAERMARHAEWARRQTVEGCIALVSRTRDEVGDTCAVDAVLTRLISDLRHLAESREAMRAGSILPAEYWGRRPHTPEQVYAVRPVGIVAAVPDDGAALDLSCAGTGTRLR
jgi:hypothetical protein